jgi:cytochrome c peroxidase
MRNRTPWLMSALAAALVTAWEAAAADKGAPAAGEGAKAPAKPLARRTLRLPETPYRYADVELPAHFKTFAARRFDNTPADNPVTDAGAALGRALFYDVRLSANGTIACGSCHLQKNAFTVPERFGKGFEGKPGDRNPMSLVNLRYYSRGRFFWDERAASLEQQALMPIRSQLELGQDLDRLTDVLAADGQYPELFRKAFGDRKVTAERTGRALAQFLRALVSCQSKYDEGLAGAGSVRSDFANFTAQENRGKGLFLRNCAVCHLPGGQAAHFVMNRPLNNGLDADVTTTDGGLGDITLRTFEVGLFKSPSLRNVEHTAPYMHDGRLATLEAVIDHYSKDVKRHPNLGGRLRRRLNFDAEQKAALVAFLKTLSDPKFLTDPKFSDPFQ